ncbi:MAG: sigma 54-dependent Fis family transcriptional regulator [Planctomycetes bacterium]|nr:sigma 54-dependent Fis family transcriptional regulator [Planctomycetota bacterium]
MTDTDHGTPPPSTSSGDRSPPTVYRLLIESDGPRREVRLTRRSYVVGRSDDCDIRLFDPAASRRHVLLEPTRGGVAFRDLGGTNVTLLDGTARREGILRPGEELLVGMTRLAVQAESATRAPVRIVPSRDSTAVIELEQANARATPPPRDGVAVDDVARTLELLGRHQGEAQDAEQVATRLLDAALQLTGRGTGMIGLWRTGEPMRVVASHQHKGEADVTISRGAFEDARSRRQAFLVQESGAGDAPANEQIVVPLGPGPNGILVLQSPLPGGVDSHTALRIAAAHGPLVWRELSSTDAVARLSAEVERLRFGRTSGYQALVASTRLAGVRRQLSEAGRARVRVRLACEVGTEREELARYYHTRSSRAAGPFVPYYCGLVPSHLAASRLLGEGSESIDIVDADDVPLVHQARGGTLFLDAPEHLDTQTQRQLANLLAHLRPSPLDPDRADGKGGVAVVLAHTENAPLEPLLAAQIDGPVLRVPPLRGHAEDILAIAEAALHEFGPDADGAPRALADAVVNVLVAHPWPGNARQLQRAIETAAAHRASGPIQLRDLPPDVRDAPDGDGDSLSLAAAERRHILKVLSLARGNRRRTAKLLDIAVSTLYDKLRRFGLSE